MKIDKPLHSIYQIQPMDYLFSLWRDAGYSSSAFIYTVFLLSISLAGILLGEILGGKLLLRVFLSFMMIFGVYAFLYFRSGSKRQQFQNQFPGVLDRLADCLEAGFSLPQAISFLVPKLAQPSASEFKKVSDQINLGFTVEQALSGLYQRRPIGDVRLLVEGLAVQRQAGGDLPAMMRRIADLVRIRFDLERDIKTMTAQGKLSSIVITLLVPISLFLLSFIPGYGEVLFHSNAGNLVLIGAGSLEMIGAVIVFRQTSVEFD